jgi:CxxC motif-containing protein
MKFRTKLRLVTLLACCAGSFYAGLQVRQPPKIVTHDVFITEHVPVYVPVKTAKKYYGEQINRIAATIPASALKMVSK